MSYLELDLLFSISYLGGNGFVIWGPAGLAIIIVIELVAILLINRDLSLLRGLWIAFAVNAFSNLVLLGMSLMKPVEYVILFWLPLFVILPLIIFKITRRKDLTIGVLAGMALGIPGYLLFINSYKLGVWAMWATIPLMVCMDFSIKTAVKCWPLKLGLKNGKLIKTLLLMNLFTALFIVIIGPYFWANPTVVNGGYRFIEAKLAAGKGDEAILASQWGEKKPQEIYGLNSKIFKRDLTGRIKTFGSEPEWLDHYDIQEIVMESFNLYCLNAYRKDEMGLVQITETSDAIGKYADYYLGRPEMLNPFSTCFIGWVENAVKYWPDAVKYVESEEIKSLEVVVEEWRENDAEMECLEYLGDRFPYFKPDPLYCIETYMNNSGMDAGKIRRIMSGLQDGESGT